MSSNLSIRHLRAFREVAQCGSFTQAAQRLHLTQSTLTATVKQLEQEIGLTLFDRTTRRVVLTREGQQFRSVAERLISDFDTAITDLQAVASQQQGQVAVAASPSTISQLLPPVIQSYHHRHPGVGISLRDDSAGAIEQRVLENDVDFGIGANHSNDPELNYEALLTDRYGIVVPADSDIHGLDEIDWLQLGHMNLLYLSADTGIRAQLNRIREQARLPDRLDGSIEVSNPAGLAALIRQGLGIAVLPALAASTEAFNELHFLPLTNPVIERELCFVSRKNRSLSPAAMGLLKQTRDYFQTMSLPTYVRLIRTETP